MELAVLHHREDARLVLQHRDVGERVAVDQQQVGEVALADVAELTLPIRIIGPPHAVADSSASIVLMPTT